MLTRKKKLKISKMLAAIIHIVENEPNITHESFGKLVSNSFDVAFEVGSFSLMTTTMKLVEELRKREIHIPEPPNTRTQQKEG